MRFNTGPAIVVAGPGSGKTFTTIRRLEFLICEAGVKPSSILLITFTRLAALEMRSRAQALLGDRAGEVSFSTFHSLFFKILRHTYRFDHNNIINSQTKISILKDVLYSLGLEPVRGSDDITGILNEISAYKSCADREEFSSGIFDTKDFINVFKGYCSKCASLRLIDFDDMPLKCRELFLSRPEVLSEWQSLFEYILIDEFQDIDPVQFELVKLLGARHNNIFAVGDDDQSIYSFRGSSPEIMLDFDKHFPGSRRIMLSDNFRSGQRIVEAAGLVIAENRHRINKDIRGKKLSGEVTLKEYRDFTEEAGAVVKRIRERDGLYGDCAILLRTNSLCSDYAEVLTREGIAFRCAERLDNIYESNIARDLLDYLKLAGGSKLRSTMFRVMNRPYRFISRESIPDNEFDFKKMKDYHRFDPATLKRIERLERDIKQLSKMKPYGAIHYILYGMGYLKYLKSTAAKNGRDAEESISTALEIKERAKGYRSHEEFLEAINDYTRELAITMAKNHRAGIKGEGDAVTIMTYHASKGLEFKEVFLPGVNEGVIPGYRIITEKEMEEERRLFYVGMTRASERLNISYHRENLTGRLKPSRFLSIRGRFCDRPQTEDKICQEEQENMQ